MIKNIFSLIYHAFNWVMDGMTRAEQIKFETQLYYIEKCGYDPFDNFYQHRRF
jgi:hypothetical protein